MQRKDALSIKRFKTESGEFVDIETLDSTEYQNFVLAKLMNKIIDTLQIAVPNDRQFTRARQEVMSAFHSAADEIHKRDE